jgi:hypothetical protein
VIGPSAVYFHERKIGEMSLRMRVVGQLRLGAASAHSEGASATTAAQPDSVASISLWPWASQLLCDGFIAENALVPFDM